MKHALWALNGLLGVGIAAFALTHLVIPTSTKYLADIDPRDARPSPPPKPGDRPNEEALLTLRNPLRHRDEEPIRRPDPTLSLHGSLPTLDGVQGVAFIRTNQDVSLVVPIGEEVQGWKLAELWKDRAFFTDAEGRTLGLEMTSNLDVRTHRRR